MKYRKTQFAGILTFAIGLTALGVLVNTWYDGFHPLQGFVAATMILILLLFYSLTIEITSTELRCFFGSGLIRRTFQLTEIVDATSVTNKWYYGWGIRLTPRGWMFNVSGLKAVELTFASGKRFRIGTDEPEKIVRILNSL